MVSVQQPADNMGDNPIFMEGNIERDCSKLGGLFQILINDLKTSVPHWEDFQTKAAKLHTQLKATVLSMTAFLESFQRLADLATGSRGATKELGASLTRLCLRHKAIEYKLKSLSSSLMDYLVMPLQDRIEDWKRITVQLDKDHAKEYKKARQEIKKKSSDTLRLQKKARKGKTSVQYQLDSAMQEVGDMFILLEETEKNAVRKALIEERGRYIYLVNSMRPTIEDELSMLSEMVHLQSVLEELGEQVKEPHGLPPSSEQIILDIKGQEGQVTYSKPVKDYPLLREICEEELVGDDDDSDHYVELPPPKDMYPRQEGVADGPPPVKDGPRTPPGSPTLSSGSRKSSLCGSIGSMNSADSRSSSSLTSGNSGHSAHSHPSAQGSHHRNRSLSTPLNPAHRLSSVSSQDSGFTSQDTLVMRPGTPTSQAQQHAAPGTQQNNNDYTRQPSTGSTSSGDSTPSSSPCQQYAPMGPAGTPATAQPALATLGRRSNRPKPVPTPTIPVRVPHEKLPTLPVTQEMGQRNFDRPQSDQIVPQPKTPQENVEHDWTKRSATLPHRRSHSVASPYGIGGTMPRNVRPNATMDLNGSHDSGYGEPGQFLPPPMGFESQEFTIEENPYLIPESDSVSSGSGSMSQSSSHSSVNLGQHPPPSQQHVKPGSSTPARHRHSSVEAIYNEPTNEHTYQNMARSKGTKDRPPPPIRKTPSTEQMEALKSPTQWENPTYGKSQLDESGQFKVPHPVQPQGIYDVPTQWQRPPTMTRSKSLASPNDLQQDIMRLSLMENLNAKLALRNSVIAQTPGRGNPQTARPPTVQENHDSTLAQVSRNAPPQTYPLDTQRTEANEALYDVPSQVYPQMHADLMDDLPPPPDDFMGSPVVAPPPEKVELSAVTEGEEESIFQVALKANRTKLKRTETMDRSAPRIIKKM